MALLVAVPCSGAPVAAIQVGYTWKAFKAGNATAHQLGSLPAEVAPIESSVSGLIRDALIICIAFRCSERPNDEDGSIHAGKGGVEYHILFENHSLAGNQKRAIPQVGCNFGGTSRLAGIGCS